MNKKDLIESIRHKTGLEKKTVMEVLDAILDTIKYAFREDIRLELRHFGTFYLDYRKKRTGRNPKTGKKIHIPAVKKPSFKPSKKLVFLDKRSKE